MELILHDEEAQLLRQVLTQHISNLKLEIGGTENYSWRQSLKEDAAMLKGIITRLDQAVDDAEAPEPIERTAEQAVEA